jgi:hypothetical protein
MDTNSETDDNIKTGVREAVISKCVVDSTERLYSQSYDRLLRPNLGLSQRTQVLQNLSVCCFF